MLFVSARISELWRQDFRRAQHTAQGLQPLLRKTDQQLRIQFNKVKRLSNHDQAAVIKGLANSIEQQHRREKQHDKYMELVAAQVQSLGARFGL